MSHAVTHRGFTLIEAVVAIAISALIAALLMSAIMSARRASFRLQCLNNLSQVGLALSSYASANGSLPPPSSYQYMLFIPSAGFAISGSEPPL
jgi:prepilin-type N-terminal cleavage/methylation domain-containing protein